MAATCILNQLRKEDSCYQVDLFAEPQLLQPEQLQQPQPDSVATASAIKTNGTVATTTNGVSADSPNAGNKLDASENPTFSLLVDAECCLDRLYGGYYSDWASGGQWNRMLLYLNNLTKACQSSHVQITVVIRGGVEMEHAEELFKANKEFRHRLDRVMNHLQNRGTPPPKVWWLPPTCLRQCLALAMQFYGIPVLCTAGDFYKEVLAHARSHNVDGIMTDNGSFIAMNPPRLFAAHDFKLTYKGSLETREYSVKKWLASHQISEDRVPLLVSLLGTHIVTPESIEEFHKELVSSTSEKVAAEECEEKVLSEVINFVRKFPDPKNLDAIGQVVFRNSSTGLDENIAKLKESVAYFQEASSITSYSAPFNTVNNMTEQSQQNGTSPVVQNGISQQNGSTEGEQYKDKVGDNSEIADHENTSEEHVQEALDGLTINGEKEENTKQIKCSSKCKEKPVVKSSPGTAVMQLANDRHMRGYMNPIIRQCLAEKEVRLRPSLEDPSSSTSPGNILLYRPIRASIYAILHNLNKQLYDARKLAEECGDTINNEDISIEVTEHYLSPLGMPTSVNVKVLPVTWPVPSVESLWLGVKPENRQRRIKAFLSCMGSGLSPMMVNTSYVPERYLIICSVLRYLLQCEPSVISLSEVDAVLCMTSSEVLYDVQTMQDMQLPLLTAHGAHISSMIMAGIEHAILVNDACGAPIPRQHTCPWLYFDGKLLQYKLLKASSSAHTPLLDLCDGQLPQVVLVERMRQAVVAGLDGRVGIPQALPRLALSPTSPARIMVPPPAFLRPIPPAPAGRGGKGILGDYVPQPRQQADTRGGKLQVAGQVVASWGPNTSRANTSTINRAVPAGFNVQMNIHLTGTPNNNQTAQGKKKSQKPFKSYSETKQRNTSNNNNNTGNHTGILTKPELDEIDVKVLPDAPPGESVIDCSTDSGIAANSSP